MRTIDYARLVILGAIWGGSFIFLRTLAPEFGAIPTACGRLFIGGGVLMLYIRANGTGLDLAAQWRRYAVIAVISCAFPFAFYGYAALHIPAAYSAIFNSTASLFVAVFAAVWLAEAVTLRKLGGLGLGILGVALVANRGGADTSGSFYIAVLACLGAATCYALAAIFTKRHLLGAPPTAIAACSQLMGGVLLLPLLLIDPPQAPSTSVALNLAGLGIICSGVAYLFYYRLIADIGPTRTLTVTFLQPVFAMIWAAIFLGEAITSVMIVGCGLVLAGTLLVTRAPAPAPASAIDTLVEPATGS